MTYKHLSDVVAANDAAGRHWFSADTMEFFGTILETDLIDGQFFITSEQPPHGPRNYTIRATRDDGTIATMGDFGQYETLDDALDTLRAGGSDV